MSRRLDFRYLRLLNRIARVLVKETMIQRDHLQQNHSLGMRRAGSRVYSRAGTVLFRMSLSR